MPITNLFIFRRDLRTVDNHALNAAAADGASVMPVFIYNRQQTSPRRNRYFSRRAFDYMNVSISDLIAIGCPALGCYETSGDDLKIIKRIVQEARPAGVYFNADLASPFARARDQRIADFCAAAGIECHRITTDYSLVDPSQMAKSYQKMNAFVKKYLSGLQKELNSKKIDVGLQGRVKWVACPCKSGRIEPHKPKSSKNKKPNKSQTNRALALDILQEIKQGKFSRYATTRDDIPNERGTTRLSVHLKFGVVSVREAFAAARGVPALQREFLIRAFYDQVAYHFKLLPLRREPEWNDPRAPRHFEAWTRGRTGFPLVDAAMRQLSATGFMHNRCRMLVASFLVKALHVDWREGERWFATQLVDYHPAANNGGWQWAAGTGTDSQPYFRFFSPWIQSAKHDPDADYIKRHVPELRDVPAKAIHTWFKAHAAYPGASYPAPIVDNGIEVKKTLAAYKMLYKKP